MSKQKESIALCLIWVLVITVSILSYLMVDSDGWRFILFLVALMASASRLVEWLFG